MNDATTIRALVDDYLSQIAVTFTARYVGQTEKPPFGKDGKPWQCDQWQVTFQSSMFVGVRNKGGLFTTDYFTGLGHRAIPKIQKFMAARELEDYHSSQHARITAKYSKPVAPHAADVLYSLCMDAQAINQSFSDWCDELGSDSDSISALNTYQACERIGRDMQAFFGRDAMGKLRELTEGL